MTKSNKEEDGSSESSIRGRTDSDREERDHVRAAAAATYKRD